jgi:membrane protease YdiL (CAAX protease family)
MSEGDRMKIPAGYVLPIFLLIVLVAPVVLGPLVNLILAPLGVPFHRVMSRALLISALGALVLFRSHLRLREWWPGGAIARRQMALGLVLAILSSSLMIALYSILCGVHSAGLTFGHAVLATLTALVASLIVPVLEETIFRGFLVTILTKSTGRWIAWLLAAGIYAVAHFLRFPPEGQGQGTRLWSGVTAMISVFTHLGQGDFLTGRGFNLFVVGLILGGIFLRTGTLWVNAALHGGWIFILMTFTALTRPVEPPHFPRLEGDLLSSPRLPRYCSRWVLDFGSSIDRSKASNDDAYQLYGEVLGPMSSTFVMVTVPCPGGNAKQRLSLMNCPLHWERVAVKVRGLLPGLMKTGFSC